MTLGALRPVTRRVLLAPTWKTGSGTVTVLSEGGAERFPGVAARAAPAPSSTTSAAAKTTFVIGGRAPPPVGDCCIDLVSAGFMAVSSPDPDGNVERFRAEARAD